MVGFERLGAIGWTSGAERGDEGWVVGPVLVALGVAEPGFVAPEDVVPVGLAGLDAVFLDEAPTICSTVSGEWGDGVLRTIVRRRSAGVRRARAYGSGDTWTDCAGRSGR